MNLVHVLYDDRLTNEQRLVISQVIRDNATIEQAKIYDSKVGAQLWLWCKGLVPYRVDPQGNRWAVAR